MKNLFLLCLALISYGSYAQTGDHSDKLKVEYKADSTVYNSKNNVMELIGNVNFKDSKISVTADNAVINQDAKQIIVTGIKEFSFNGKVVVAAKSARNVLRYVIGSDTIYFD